MFAASKTASVSGGYQISRSLRFNSADSAYLNRTPASASNRRTYTWSGWVKRSTLIASGGVPQNIFGARDGNYTLLRFNYFADPGNTIRLEDSGFSMITLPVYRDVSAWYHIVLAVDTTQATNTNRVKLYVNNVLQTFDGTYTSYPTQNYDTQVNNNIAHNIGAQPTYGDYFNGYMTEVNFIDGQALTPSSFGETNAQTGVWQPKAYSGSYGTNGFYLNFSDNSNTTAATLGKDYSGNGNNWTPNNFSVTAGAGNDSMVDTPTSYGTDTGVGGTVRGNYAILNPLTILPTGQALSITNGNLDYSGTSGWWGARSSIGMTSGKWYCEVTITGGSTPYNTIVGLTTSQAAASGADFYPGLDAYGWGYFGSNGRKFNNGTSTAYGNNFGLNVTVGIAFDADAGSLTFYESGTSQGVAFTGLTNGPYFFTFAQVGASGSINFGQRPFAYTAPSGYKALCTQNLPTPTIGATTATQAGKYFNPVLYTGNGTTQSITGVGFQPDWVWIKERSSTGYNVEYDAVRGVEKYLFTNTTGAEGGAGSGTGVTVFGSDGFTAVQGGSVEVNRNAITYVAWNWKANGSGSTNTAGSITSTVSANTTSGFSVVTFTGTGATGTVGHGLGVAPSMIITKVRNNADNWFVYHASVGATGALFLSTTAAVNTSANFWNNTAPTSSVFTVGSAGFPSGWTEVAYCFAEVAGYSKFGSYTGNGSTDGPMVYFGFRPAFVMLKNTTTAGNDWQMIDVVRGTYNVEGPTLVANYSGAENTYTICDFLSNGVKFRDTNQAWNKSGDLYIYMAFASNPFKTSLAR